MMLRQRVGMLMMFLSVLLMHVHASEQTSSHLASSLQSLSTSRQGVWARLFGSENQPLTLQQATQLGQAWENAPFHMFRDSPGYFDVTLHGLVLDSIWDTAPSAFTPSSTMQQGFDYQILKQRWNGRDEQRFTLPMPLFPINSSKLIYPLHTKHSLYLHRLNYRSAPVASIADAFTNILGFPCSVSYIRTPSWSFEGRGPHFHSHSTFILQVRGRQNASVHMESTVFQHGSHHHEVPHMLHQPFLHDQSLKAFAAPFAAHATATRAFHLRPGSLLYVPSGFVHSLSTQPIETALPPMQSPDDSEHLEVAVEIDAVFTVTGFLHALIEHVKKSVPSELSAPYSCEPPLRQQFDASDGVEWRWSHIAHFLLDEVAHRSPNVLLRRTLTFFSSNQPKHGSTVMPSWFDVNVRQAVTNAVDIFVNSASIEHLLHAHDAPLCRIMSQSDLFQAPQGVSSRQYMSHTKRTLHCPRFKPASPLEHAKLHRSPHNVHDDEGFAELRYGSWHPRLQQWFDLPSEPRLEDEDYRLDRAESEPNVDIYSDSDAGDVPLLTSRAQQALDIVATRELSEMKLHEHEHSFEFSHTHVMNRIKSLELRLRVDPALADQYLPKDDSHPHYQEGFVHQHDDGVTDEPVWRHVLRDILPASVSDFLQLHQPYQPLPTKVEHNRDSGHTAQSAQRSKPATSRMIRLHSLIGQCIRQRSSQSADFIVQQTLSQLKVALLDEGALAAAARDVEKLAAQTRLEYYRQRDASLKQHETAKRSWKAPERTPHEEVELIRQKARADALISMNNNRLKTEL